MSLNVIPQLRRNQDLGAIPAVLDRCVLFVLLRAWSSCSEPGLSAQGLSFCSGPGLAAQRLVFPLGAWSFCSETGHHTMCCINSTFSFLALYTKSCANSIFLTIFLSFVALPLLKSLTFCARASGALRIGWPSSILSDTR